MKGLMSNKLKWKRLQQRNVIQFQGKVRTIPCVWVKMTKQKAIIEGEFWTIRGNPLCLWDFWEFNYTMMMQRLIMIRMLMWKCHYLPVTKNEIASMISEVCLLPRSWHIMGSACWMSLANFTESCRNIKSIS